MRWDRFRTSRNVEDRRGQRSVAGGLGIGTILILGIVGYALGIDPRVLIQGAEMVSGGGSAVTQSTPGGTPDDETGRFVAAVIGSTEDVFHDILPTQANVAYQAPRLALFTGQTQSGCGFAQSATGPFYCPLDQTIYLDTSFFAEMDSRLGGGGDFAYAYVIAHEAAHHVQNVVGILPKVQEARRATSQAEANALSVGLELMADCIAGVWAHHADARWSILEEGDIEEALSTAAAIGDDRLQRVGQGQVVPDSFTHGSSEQRMTWFTTGFNGGDIRGCNTFER
ncbi:MAG: neutral zinc metallopeptidase [Microvirga sp.]|nr:neutral zinc metallopeptidase [Microvirga sp.]